MSLTSVVRRCVPLPSRRMEEEGPFYPARNNPEKDRYLPSHPHAFIAGLNADHLFELRGCRVKDLFFRG
jgi:hypothetical protein